MSRPTGQIRDGDGPLEVVFNPTGGEEEEEEEDTPLLSRPRRNLRASYMLTAFLSTLLTITDCETDGEEREMMRNKETQMGEWG